MTTKKEEAPKIITIPFRVSFPELKAPKSFNGSEPKYGVQMVFPNDITKMPKRADGKPWPGNTVAMLKKIAQAVRDEKWPDKAKYPKCGLKNPFINGDDKDLDSHKDSTVINAKSKFAIPCVSIHRGDDGKPLEITDMEELYAGCWALARLTCYAYEIRSPENKKAIISAGVAFGLSSLQKVADDTKFSGRGNAKDDFDAVELDGVEFEENTSTEEVDENTEDAW